MISLKRDLHHWARGNSLFNKKAKTITGLLLVVLKIESTALLARMNEVILDRNYHNIYCSNTVATAKQGSEDTDMGEPIKPSFGGRASYQLLAK